MTLTTLIFQHRETREKQEVIFNSEKVVESLQMLTTCQRNMRLINVEGEGKLADYFREELAKREMQKKNYKPNKLKLIQILALG